MKKFYNLKMMLLVALLSLVGVSVNAQEVAYKTLDFAQAEMESCDQYDQKWTATFSDDTWVMNAFSNYSNVWKYVKCGSHKEESTATITTGTAYEKALTKVVVTIDKITTNLVKNIQLQISNDTAFSSPTTITAPISDLKAGDLVFAISAPRANAYYRLVFNCKKPSNKKSKKNGYVQISKIVYYAAASAESHDVKVNIGATGYATLYYSDRALVVPENVYAYTYKVTNGKLDESYLYNAGETIPAATGVVLKAAPGEYTFAASQNAGDVDADNLLKGSDEAALTTGGAVYYKLSLNKAGDANSVGFYYGAADGAAFTNGAHKAYLALPAASGVRAFLFNGNTTTGIQNATANNAASQVYDLQGRRVQSAQKGLYIINGKKVLVK
jgi:hypothetical protein